jgi:hypothetical protein
MFEDSRLALKDSEAIEVKDITEIIQEAIGEPEKPDKDGE